MSRFITSLFLCLILQLPNAKSQAIMEIVPSAYDLKNGLADNNVVDGLLDEKNLLWLATSNGLSCFDGQYFINYSATNPNFKISSSTVNSITRINTTIYVATNKGIDKIDALSKKSYPVYTAAAEENIVKVFATRQGQLISITAKGNCKNLFSDKKIQLPFQATEYFVAEDEQQRLYISSFQKDFCVIDLSTHQQTNYISKTNNPIYGLLYKKGAGLLSLNFRGIFKYNPFVKKEEPYLQSDDFVNGFTEIDNSSFLTIHDFNKIIYHDQSAATYDIKVLLTGNAIYKKMLMDKNGTAILLSNTGIYCFKLPLRFQSIVPDNQIANQPMVMVRRAMLEMPNKKILLFSYRGIQEYDPLSNTSKTISNEPLVNYTAVQDGNTVWIGTDGKGLFKFDYITKKFSSPILSKSALNAEHIFALCKEPDGKLLLGYYIPFGLREYDPITKTLTDIALPYGNAVPTQSRISHISQDETGHYWIATDNGLFELDANKKFLYKYDAATVDDKPHLPSNAVNYCCHVSATQVWVATDNGIALIDKKNRTIIQTVGVKENMPGGKCIAILEDANNRLWISSYKGLSCFIPESKTVYNFYKEDGMPDDEYNYMASLKSSTGELYFGGLNGIVRINPAKWNTIQQKAVLQFTLLQKEIDKGAVDLIAATTAINGIKLMQSKEAMEIRFGFNEFINPEYCKYWYRIKGVDDNWTSLGNDGHLRLWNLPAGEFIVQIKGDNAKGIASNEMLELPISVILPFYQTTYFKLIIALVILIIIALSVWQRYQNQAAIRSIKTGMLNDIHDEVGSILTKTAMKAELLNMKFGNEVKGLEEIQRFSREAIQSLRNLLWSISSEKMSTQEFEDRIKDWMQFVFADTSFEVQFVNQIPDNLFIDSVEVRRNIILIIKELAHNTLKHSNGNEFKILLTKKGKKYSCTVSDNGKNTDENINLGGYGLKSIETRAKKMGGKVKFEKNKNGFTTSIIF